MGKMKITNASVEINGLHDGKRVTITGALEDVTLESEYSVQEAYDMNMRNFGYFKYWLNKVNFRVVDNKAVHVQYHGTEIEHVVTTHIDNQSRHERDKVREAIKAPRDAVFHYINVGDDLNIRFTWKETIFP